MPDVLPLLESLPIDLMLIGAVCVLVMLIAIRRIGNRRKYARNIRERQIAQAEAVRKVEQAPRLDADWELPLVVYPMPVMGLLEERMFDAIEDIAAQSVMGHRVLTQLSLAAFLYAGQSGATRAQEREATGRLAARQVDFLIVDADWRPVLVINLERDGNASSDPEAIEVEACAQAGIGYLVVGANGLTDAERAEIRGYLSDARSIAAE